MRIPNLKLLPLDPEKIKYEDYNPDNWQGGNIGNMREKKFKEFKKKGKHMDTQNKMLEIIWFFMDLQGLEKQCLPG